MTIQKYLLTLFLLSDLFGASFSVCAQGQKEGPLAIRPWQLGIRGHYGFIIPHSADLKEVSTSNPAGFELGVARLNILDSDWEQFNCYSRTHLFYSYFNYNNPLVLGASHNVALALEPIIAAHRRLNLGVRLGAGFSYLTVVYDSISNPSNTFFSLPVSGFLQIDLALRYNMAKRWNIVVSGSYSHISNGGLKQPNKGMNFPTASIGFEYVPNRPEMPKRKTDKSFHGKRLFFEPLVYSSIKVAGQEQGFEEKSCFIYGLIVTAGYHANRFHAFQGGFDFTDDGYIRENIQRKNENTDHKRLSILAGHRLIMGKFAFLTQLGAYIYAPYTGMNPVYQRYSLLYHLPGNVSFGVYVKAHKHVAELMGIAVGIGF